MALSSSAVGFTAGGIDVASIVTSLMDAERIPQSRLSKVQASIQLKADTITRMKSGFESLRSVANQLTSTSLAQYKSSVSNSAAVQLSVGSTASGGSVAFTVDRLAGAQGLRSANTFASSSSAITTATTMAVSSTLAKLGVDGVAVSSGTAVGSSAVTVTQSSASAIKFGGTALGSSVTLNATNNALKLSVNGTTYTATVAQGTYNAASLATAVQTALTAAGAPATASLDSSGVLKLATVREGSGATLQVATAGQGSTALSSLGLTADTTANAGVDGKIRVGTGAAVKVGGALGSWPLVIPAATTYAVTANNGSATQVTITPGSYADSTALATAVQTSLTAAGVQGLVVTADSAGALKVATTLEGSAASFQFTSTGSDPLGLVSAAPVVGTDGTTVTVAESGANVSVAGTSGTTSFTLSGGLRAGSGSVTVISTGDKSLGAVVAAINGANAGISAAAVRQTEGKWLLQVGSKTTGTLNRVALDASGMASLGGMIETSAAQDAKITIGSGAGSYSVEASGNVFTDVLAGVTITATALSTTQVSVSVDRDDATTADNVESFIAAANSVLGQIAMQTGYDVATKKASPLTGESAIRNLADQIRNLVTTAVAGSTTGAVSKVGLTVQKDGSFLLDRTMFMAALKSDEADVDRLFNRGGSGTGGVSFGSAAEGTVAGTYAVQITQAPTRASVTDVMAGLPNTARVIGVKVGSTTVSVSVTAGASRATTVSALNAQFASTGMALTASVGSNNELAISANSLGSAGTFSVNNDVSGSGVWSATSGLDVAGTINGEVATGIGQRLTMLSTSTSNAKGLAIDIAEGSSAGTKSITYVPGIAARLATMAATVTGTTGTLGVAGTGFEARVKTYTTQIDAFEVRLTAKETNLRARWAAVQSSLATLKSQQSWLTDQVKSMTASS